MAYRFPNIKLPLDWSEKGLDYWAAKKLDIKQGDIAGIRIIKKSVDARDKSDVRFVFTLDVTLRDGARPPKGAAAAEPAPAAEKIVPRHMERRPVVVGMGPAGLFAALTLAENGLRPVVIERGRPVDERANDVLAFNRTGELKADSNVLFGEGGAGAFSDGKLNSGINDPRCARVLNALYECGAPEEILCDSRPHVGTDIIRGVVKNLRERIISLGGEVIFSCRLKSLVIEGGALRGMVCERDGADIEIETGDAILAIGHSSRDTLTMLRAAGVSMTQKPFSIGVRIEHSQKMINRSQYGAFADSKYLGAADYRLSERLKNGRGVYTFCMCPGGEVVASASEAGGVVTNGMSYHARSGENANSALLVSVEPSDFGSADLLAGVEFQRKYERLAFELGGGAFTAPAQLCGDFMRGTPSSGALDVMPTYPRGVNWTDLKACLPGFAVSAMKEALPVFGRRVKGFDAPGAVMTGVETRSSSPVRIDRGADCVSVSLPGLYPCGEGAGYAGGILSSAVDGIRCAEALMKGRGDD